MTRNEAGGIDWNFYQKKARKMTDAALHGARLDCMKTAVLWDPSGHENAGLYRDESSVYKAEQDRRRKSPRGGRPSLELKSNA